MDIKILIINDSPAINFMFKNRLELGGFSVETAETGEVGVEKARAGEYQLILLDYKLPGIDGAEVCRILKGDEDTKDITVVFMSSSDGEKMRKILADTGADGYIDGLLEGDELIEKVREFING